MFLPGHLSAKPRNRKGKGMIVKVNVDGGMEFHEGPMDLDKMMEHIGGWVVSLPLKTPGMVMLVCEDGLPRGLVPNEVASIMAGQRLVGPALVMMEQELGFEDEAND